MYLIIIFILAIFRKACSNLCDSATRNF